MLYFGTRARMFRIDQFLNRDVKRMLRKLQNIDKSALPMEDLLEVTDRAPGLPGTHTPASKRRVGQLGLGTRVSRAGAAIGGMAPELPVEEEGGTLARPTSPGWWG